jgi:hypothetical protein
VGISEAPRLLTGYGRLEKRRLQGVCGHRLCDARDCDVSMEERALLGKKPTAHPRVSF